jgi:pilus assembly protein Flp/PilA
MKTLMNRFVKDESGATAIEYGLIAALIAVAIITALQLLGGNISARFREIATTIGTAIL